MAGMQTADNEVLVGTVRELASQLARHVVPRLLQWREQLARASVILIARETEGGGGGGGGGGVTSDTFQGSSSSRVSSVGTEGSSVLGKRAMPSSGTQALHINATSMNTAAVETACALVDRLLDEVRDMLVRKCKPLFRH